MSSEPANEDLQFLHELLDKTAEVIADALPDGGALFKEILFFRNTLLSETDRGCALMAAAFMEDRLGDLLSAFMVDDPKLRKEMLSFSGPIGSFSSRIDMAYSLGLIPKNIRRELHLLRKIRNTFAHTARPLEFDDAEIKNRCNLLSIHNKTSIDSAKSKFTRSMMCILSLITTEILRVKRRAFKEDFCIDNVANEAKGFQHFLQSIGREDLVDFMR